MYIFSPIFLSSFLSVARTQYFFYTMDIILLKCGYKIRAGNGPYNVPEGDKIEKNTKGKNTRVRLYYFFVRRKGVK